MALVGMKQTNLQLCENDESGKTSPDLVDIQEIPERTNPTIESSLISLVS